jgi:Protein of unknown function (DUF429)
MVNGASMRVIAVDWSGDAHLARSRIWLAQATCSGQLNRLECGRDRIALTQHLVAEARDEHAIIGLDFGFSFPVWFLVRLGVRSATELWARATEEGEGWLAACTPPFWGRRGRPRPSFGEMGAQFRRTELAVPRTGGVGPKSMFQIGGAGAVGTGSVRGMALLHALHHSGGRVWPFTNGPGAVVVEIYPRLLTGAVHKSRASARAEYLARRYPNLDAEHLRAAENSEDAFDAAVSALVMIEHVADLSTLPVENDPRLALEGRIWHPAWRSDRT